MLFSELRPPIHHCCQKREIFRMVYRSTYSSEIWDTKGSRTNPRGSPSP